MHGRTAGRLDPRDGKRRYEGSFMAARAAARGPSEQCRGHRALVGGRTGQPRVRRVLVCLIALLSACGRNGLSEPEVPAVTGTWTLEVPGFDAGPDGPSGTFILKESSTGQLTGSGSHKFPDEPLRAFTVARGTHTHPDVYLLISSSDQRSIEFLGRMTPGGDEIEGVLGLIPAVLVRR